MQLSIKKARVYIGNDGAYIKFSKLFIKLKSLLWELLRGDNVI